jgi:pimeloyl-ACP methyl ester carboxylesterase
VMILHGYAMQPSTYMGLAELLARQCRVLIPDLFSGPGRWSADTVVRRLVATLEGHAADQVTLVGHSFGGALELGLATSHPGRVREAVFADTLAMSREWTLAAEALHPVHLAWMATPKAAVDFFRSWVDHPRQLVNAAWWGFTSDRRQQVAALARTGIPCHVLWADRDSLLNRADGERFARDMDATFTVVSGRDGKPVDHDWLYRHPQLAMEHLCRLGLDALAGGGWGVG